MEYFSTRNKEIRVSSAQAIAQGISVEGGLFVPVEMPQYTEVMLEDMVGKSYQQRAEKILASFLTDFTAEEIKDSVSAAYRSPEFPEKVAPVKKVTDTLFSLELWHGPTCAFKDMALQLLPHLLTKSTKKVDGEKEVVILVATSGDTGKAALEGFQDVEGTHIFAFYPDGGVSPVQYLQMATQQGKNVGVFGVQGNFDDTQTGVKKIFTDEKMKALLEENNYMFSSANSINWGRLLPQIVYYFSAYLDLVAAGELSLGDKLNIVVPTGNFGNILAAYYAKNMGLPLGKLICASNENNVLTDFMNTGTYDRRRDFVLTSSPSMDILVSSNLERLLFALYQNDSAEVASLMQQLTENGVYQVTPEAMGRLQKDFCGGFATEEQVKETIVTYFNQHNYVCDTHTAVAIHVYDEYVKSTGDRTKTVVASTANPYKFANSMVEALDPSAVELDDFATLERLHEITGLEVPEQIANLQTKEVRFHSVCKPSDMPDVVKQALNI